MPYGYNYGYGRRQQTTATTIPPTLTVDSAVWTADNTTLTADII